MLIQTSENNSINQTFNALKDVQSTRQSHFVMKNNTDIKMKTAGDIMWSIFTTQITTKFINKSKFLATLFVNRPYDLIFPRKETVQQINSL